MSCGTCQKKMCCDPEENGTACPIWEEIKKENPFRACARCISFCECLPLVQINEPIDKKKAG